VPLKSVAAAWPAADAVAAHKDSHRRLQQPGDAAYKAVQLRLEEVLQQQQQQQQQQLLEQAELDQQTTAEIAAAAVSRCQNQHHSSSSSSSSQQCDVKEVHEQLLQEQQGDCLIGALPEQQASLQSVTYGYNEQLWQLPQWQVVQCSAAQLDQPDSSTCVEDAAAVPEASLYGGSSVSNSSSTVGNISRSTHGSSKKGSSSQREGNTQQTRPAAAPQPEPLYRLVAAAKQRQQYDPHVLQQLLQQLQPLLPQLAPEHLAHAAWAAAQLAEQQQPSQAWLSALLEAAESCFQSSSSSSRQLTAASTATLLQALVKLQQQPSQAWLSACCSSMQLQQWTCPRALSTVAACLPQLGHVPEAFWAESFFAASAAALPAFPAISLARMLHGVTAWSHLQQQQQHEDGMGPGSLHLAPPQSWLLPVLASLNQQSSQLKPAELAMVLQSLQRLQQQQQVLLPVAGQQASSQLHQAGQQLLHSLMAAVLQQLPKFQTKDLTVMLLAVASLHEQQQQVVSWLWLLRVFRGVEVRLTGMLMCALHTEKVVIVVAALWLEVVLVM
jgi:hypothetical protein